MFFFFFSSSFFSLSCTKCCQPTSFFVCCRINIIRKCNIERRLLVSFCFNISSSKLNYIVLQIMTPHGIESQISVSSTTLVFIALDRLSIRFAFFRQCCKCLVPVYFERNLYSLFFLQTSFSLQLTKPKDLSLIPCE